ncbi:amino acid ABC transporter permease [Microbacterium sp. MYb66]|jgi:polar amino acid transport system permease protein|uniref:amino acid ABC transporter permease n=1 Tax=Microbacterium sp. MYb66 TaxID=1848692 RepID=UPI000CFE93E4|nr:amino acid ABC transporter permease [Microbacterium sp. MYb66]PRA81186.1 ABC transporter permease [Microbacterium sp. MYb66]
MSDDSSTAERVIPVRHRGRFVAGTVAIILLGGLLYFFATNEQIRWDAVGRYLFGPTVLQGVWVTIQLTVLSMVIGVVLGVVLAVMRQSANGVLRWIAGLYIWFFRGTPVLVQIVFWFNIALFVPMIGVGEFQVSTNQLVTGFVAALLALSLNEAAYMAEIIRAGITSIDRGQGEAAAALGYTPLQTMTRIILPQALRVIVPPTGNETINMLKTTSLVSVVAAQDLLTRVQEISARNYLVIELLIVASIWYIAMTTVASVGQYYLERRLSRGYARTPDKLTFRSVLRGMLPLRSTARSTS